MAFELPTEMTQMLTPGEGAGRPMPEGIPAGFEKAGTPTLASMPTQSALPEPPAGYHPGPLAPIKREYEDSTLYKIGTVLSSFGEQIPTNIKIRMAQQASDLKEQENKLAWDNYYKNNEITRELSKKQNREASEQFVKLLPGMKAEITSMFGMPEEDQLKFVNHFATIADSLQPGGGDFLRFYHKNQSAVLLGDDIASSPDPSISGPAQEQIARMGYFNWLQTKEHGQLAEQLGYDYVTTQTLQFPKPMKDKLAAGTMTEAEYKKLLKETAFANGMRPVSVQGMISHLATPAGQNQMIHLGVQTDAMAAKKEAKEKVLDPAGELKNQRILRNKAILEDPDKDRKYTPQFLAEVKNEMDIDTSLAAKRTNPVANPGGDKAIRMQTLSRGMYRTIDEATQEQDPTRQPQALRWAAQAIEESDKARAQGSMDVQMASPGDTSEYIDLNELRRTGRALGLKGEFSKRDLLTNKRYGKATPEQKKQLSELNVAYASANDIFDLADKAFKGNAYAESVADRTLSAPDSYLNAPVKTLAKSEFPDLAVYVSRREATLGKFARSISGEVGVLTDQDVNRVRNLFALGGDSAAIRKAKKAALNALIKLNRQFAVDVIAGEMLPEDIEALKKSDKYQSAVNGIFGSVEGLPTPKENKPSLSTTPEGKPSGSTGVNKLMQDLEAGR